MSLWCLCLPNHISLACFEDSWFSAEVSVLDPRKSRLADSETDGFKNGSCRCPTTSTLPSRPVCARSPRHNLCPSTGQEWIISEGRLEQSHLPPQFSNIQYQTHLDTSGALLPFRPNDTELRFHLSIISTDLTEAWRMTPNVSARILHKIWPDCRGFKCNRCDPTNGGTTVIISMNRK